MTTVRTVLVGKHQSVNDWVKTQNFPLSFAVICHNTCARHHQPQQQQYLASVMEDIGKEQCLSACIDPPTVCETHHSAASHTNLSSARIHVHYTNDQLNNSSNISDRAQRQTTVFVGKHRCVNCVQNHCIHHHHSQRSARIHVHYTNDLNNSSSIGH
jgi:hypothetical protein